ncbi:response regulator [Paenibacillus sp. GD4]|jgi:two-component system, response regulator YesN|uniref:response regulator transcription factor n=1 Tax=Paenibacillus sp. GD4 TaxID=3068890 RepID=UPI0027969682|nr:response regulator [Paenibacillus sp. GD4]MDQ1909191.1 response regulator [Paenibacillus sp. GD4]
MNVLIVDDEPIIRQVLKTMMDWEAHGFSWHGEAEDGAEALKAVKEDGVDIVVTDILMPRMDGLELIKQLQEERFDGAMVVLSCLDDFHYVKQAMKLGAHDYILKPTMEPESLMKVLLEAKEALLEKRRGRLERELWRESSERTRAVQLGLLLRPCLEGSASQEAMAELQSALFPAQSAPAYASMLLRHAGDDQLGTERAWPEAEVWCPLGEREVLVLCTSHSEAPEGLFLTYARECWGLAAKECEISSVGGIATLRELILAYRRHLQIHRSRFYGINFSADERTEASLPMEERHNLLRAVAGNNQEAVTHWTGELSRKLQAERPMPRRAVAFLKETAALAAAMTRRETPEFEELNQLALGEAFLHLAGVMAWFEEELSLLMRSSALDGSGSGQRNPFIRKATDYMLAHFHLPISTSDIAEHVRLSRSYLSDLYSKETGEPLSEALTRIRMEAAKRMLEAGSGKVYEIAEAVGFSDAKAFTKTFKRYTGCSPKEYADRA